MDPVYKQFEEASREIGITMDNIELGVGAYGVSVQAKDTSQPIEISIPKDILLRGAQVDYGTNKVKEDARVAREGLCATRFEIQTAPEDPSAGWRWRRWKGGSVKCVYDIFDDTVYI